jgi:hypothetical protein
VIKIRVLNVVAAVAAPAARHVSPTQPHPNATRSDAVVRIRFVESCGSSPAVVIADRVSDWNG